MKQRRYRLLADKQIQGILCLRVMIYWFICMLITVGMLLFLQRLDGGNPGQSSLDKHITPTLIIVTAILPLMLYDLIAFSHRFAGPIVGFRKKLRRNVEENLTEPIKVRENDYLKEIVDDFNLMQARIDDLELQLKEARAYRTPTTMERLESRPATSPQPTPLLPPTEQRPTSSHVSNQLDSA